MKINDIFCGLNLVVENYVYFVGYRKNRPKINKADENIRFSCSVINAQGSNLEHIRERLVTFIVMEVLSPRVEFHFSE
jgi:hypothetical protein